MKKKKIEEEEEEMYYLELVSEIEKERADYIEGRKGKEREGNGMEWSNNDKWGVGSGVGEKQRDWI